MLCYFYNNRFTVGTILERFEIFLVFLLQNWFIQYTIVVNTHTFFDMILNYIIRTFFKDKGRIKFYDVNALLVLSLSKPPMNTTINFTANNGLEKSDTMFIIALLHLLCNPQLAYCFHLEHKLPWSVHLQDQWIYDMNNSPVHHQLLPNENIWQLTAKQN